MTKTFSRQELYDLVWETPVSILSQELGISDRGLAKICTRNKIPTPSRGYWARIRSGTVIEQRALPKLDKEEKPIAIVPCEAHELDQLIEQSQEPMSIVIVSKNLQKAHPLISCWLNEARNKHSQYRGWGNDYKYPISRRRLIVLDTLLKELSKLGFTIDLTQEDDCKLKVQYQAGEIEFALTILSKTDGEKLSLRVHTDDAPYLKKHWGDNSKGQLEDKLAAAILAFKIMAPLCHEAGLKREEERLRVEKERQEELEQQWRMEEELKSLHVLRLRAKNWNKAETIRGYVVAAAKAYSEGKIEISGEDFQIWKTWAFSHADQIDPLTCGRACCEEEEPEWDNKEKHSYYYPNLRESSSHWTFKSWYYRR